MKILKAEHLFSPRDYSSNHFIKRRNKTSDFRRNLKHDLSDSGEEAEEFKVLLPEHGHSWDNGYEDL